MFVKIIREINKDEVLYDCKRVGLYEVPGSSNDPPGRFIVLDVGEQDERTINIDDACQVIYMNNHGKTIDRKIFEEGLTIRS